MAKPICVCGEETDPTGTWDGDPDTGCTHYCYNGHYTYSGCYGEECKNYRNCRGKPKGRNCSDDIERLADEIIAAIPDDAEDLVTAAERAWEQVTDDGCRDDWKWMTEEEHDAVRELLHPQLVREAMDDRGDEQ